MANNATIKIGADTTQVVAEMKKVQDIGGAMAKKVGEIPRQLLLSVAGASSLAALMKGISENAERASKAAAGISEKRGETALREGVIRGQLGIRPDDQAGIDLLAQAKRPGALGEQGGMALAASLADAVAKMSPRERPDTAALTEGIRLAQEGLFTPGEVQARLSDARQRNRFTEAEIEQRRAAQTPEAKRELELRAVDAATKKEAEIASARDLNQEVERRTLQTLEKKRAERGPAGDLVYSVPFGIGDFLENVADVGDTAVSRAEAQRQIIEEQYRRARSEGMEVTPEQRERIARAAGKTFDFQDKLSGVRSTDEQNRLFLEAINEMNTLLRASQKRAEEKTRADAPIPRPSLTSRD